MYWFFSPLRRYCPPIPRNDDRIHRYILPRATVFPHSVTLMTLITRFSPRMRLEHRMRLKHMQYANRDYCNMLITAYTRTVRSLLLLCFGIFQFLTGCYGQKSSVWFMLLYPNCLETNLNYTMRTNLLNWCNLVSISKNVVFYVFLVVRIY